MMLLKRLLNNPRIIAFYAVVLGFHIAGWALFIYYGQQLGAVYAAAGGIAYSLGLRHAFDADHIAAIDDTTRYLLQSGKKAYGTGFFFSLGHCTVVILLSLAIAVVTAIAVKAIPSIEGIGGTIGTAVSGTFLIAIAIIDFFILRGLLDIWKKLRSGHYHAEHLDELLAQRGFMNRLFGGRWRKFLHDSWQMYPIGFLFGLGLDTATEVGLLALTSVTAANGNVPFGAIIALPLLFTAGMTLMDTTDGILMVRAYGWALAKPIRKIYYNIVTVGFGIFIAGLIGIIQYLKLLNEHVGIEGSFFSFIDSINFEYLGFAIIGFFIVAWVASVMFYKVRHLDEFQATS